MGLLEIAGKTRAVTGVIDRIAVDDGRVLVVDYKTNRPVPAAIDAVPQAFLIQLALYAEMLKPLYPGKHIVAALLFTAGPNLLEIPETVMVQSLAAIAGR
jgi:ATP-dependent helicase/nuclease subunit A